MKCIAPMSRPCASAGAIKVRLKKSVYENGEETRTTFIVDTTVGRACSGEIVPEGLPSTMVNQKMAKKAISTIINQCYRNVGLKATVIFADQLMYTGYRILHRSGSSIGVNDFVIPMKKQLIDHAENEVEEIESSMLRSW